jgi:hypothetical protein
MEATRDPFIGQEGLEVVSSFLRKLQNLSVCGRTEPGLVAPLPDFDWLLNFLSWVTPDQPIAPLDLPLMSASHRSSAHRGNNRWRRSGGTPVRYCSRFDEFYNQIPKADDFIHTSGPVRPKPVHIWLF